jgi:uncharacterized protein
VTDHAGVLSDAEVHRLTAELQLLEKDHLAQAIIYIEPLLPSDQVMERLTLRCANAWGIGHKETNDGIAILVFVRDRKVRIELGYGMERAISNQAAKSVIDEQMAPAFRDCDDASGVHQALVRIRTLLSQANKH